ncbi:hypothetical protein LTR09_004624 [Extremus antarcticus]|uniref:Dynamitin n=1 Tax=Extremus antarcticus TaxID=702011 RepID=A0AAJ0G9F1_9PEZI|nr:hypothetical protein LTR09_004624 [Extremus antarcticus]
MSTHPPSRLAALPGYDTAPDIYETPDAPSSPTNNTTVSTRSPSPSHSDEGSETTHSSDRDSGDEEGSAGAVLRRRFNVGHARRRFEGEGRGLRVGRHVDLGDTVGGGRRGYGLRYSGRDDGGGGVEEGLGERVARLRREVEECKALAEKEDDGDEGVEEAGLDGLGRLLASLETGDGERKRGGRRKEGDAEAGAEVDEDMNEEQTLGKVAAFDTRLAALETALGLSALDSATQTDVAGTMPLLPSLSLLDQQLAALSSATSLANLEATSSRIHKLRSEADAALTHQTTNGDLDLEADPDPTTTISPSDLQQLSQLYTLLPTLQSLAPTVPALLTRLRSLRTLHTTASSAASALEDVEKGQAELERELKAWREGLERVETAVQGASEANGRNGKVVEGWVRGLEGRVGVLLR